MQPNKMRKGWGLNPKACTRIPFILSALSTLANDIRAEWTEPLRRGKQI